MSPHRKRIRHYDDQRCLHEFTFSCYQQRAVLLQDQRPKLLAEAIDRAFQNHQWGLAAFVFMPEHVHLLGFPMGESTKVSPLLFAIKRPCSYRIKQTLVENRDPLLEELTIQQRPSANTFRFWQEGPGYDRNLESEQAVRACIDYLHLNPVRRGLCSNATDWKWSSARWYASDGMMIDDELPELTPVPVEFWERTTV